MVRLFDLQIQFVEQFLWWFKANSNSGWVCGSMSEKMKNKCRLRTWSFGCSVFLLWETKDINDFNFYSYFFNNVLLSIFLFLSYFFWMFLLKFNVSNNSATFAFKTLNLKRNNNIRFSFNQPNRKRWGANLVDVVKPLLHKVFLLWYHH